MLWVFEPSPTRVAQVEYHWLEKKKSTAGVLYLNNVVRYSASKTRTFAQWLHLLVQQVNSSLEKYDPEKAQKRISFDVEINMDEARRWVREWFALLFY